MPEFELIKLIESRGVAMLILNHAPANALNLALAKDLFHAIQYCDENPDIRAVLLTGEGKIFCAGGDLASMASSANAPKLIKEITTYLHSAIARWTHMDKPMIAAVNGSAGGAGMSIVCACDLVLSAESAKYTMAYTQVGLAPDGSSTYFLPRLVGYRRAMELMLTNRRLTAQEAYEWGIVNQVVPDDHLMKASLDLAERLASGATLAFGATKKLLHLSGSQALETQMEQETQAIASMARTADAKEGIQAFFDKRPPSFMGE